MLCSLKQPKSGIASSLLLQMAPFIFILSISVKQKFSLYVRCQRGDIFIALACRLMRFDGVYV